MSEDLSAFFAKKKDKKKKAVKLDDVGSLLERKAKKQEERDREDAEDDKNGGNDERSPQEDSDWLEYDNQSNNRLEGLRIKDMALEDTEEEPGETTEEAQAQAVPTKTWGQVEVKEAAPELIPSAAEYAAAKPTRYVPPQSRGWGTAGGGGISAAHAKIDITNQEMFPTFAAAEQIEKLKKEEVKNAWSTVGAKKEDASDAKPGVYRPPRGDAPSTAWGAAARPNRDREEAIAQARAMGATAAAEPPRPSLPTPVPPTLRKAENAYVPPHLRNKS